MIHHVPVAGQLLHGERGTPGFMEVGQVHLFCAVSFPHGIKVAVLRVHTHQGLPCAKQLPGGAREPGAGVGRVRGDLNVPHRVQGVDHLLQGHAPLAGRAILSPGNAQGQGLVGCLPGTPLPSIVSPMHSPPRHYRPCARAGRANFLKCRGTPRVTPQNERPFFSRGGVSPTALG